METYYVLTCSCGYRMRVREEHFGRTGRCRKCGKPLKVTRESVTPLEAGDFSGKGESGVGGGRYVSEDAVPAEWQVGDVILDRYEVKQIHAGGGMGVVYRVHHRGWNLDLAVKSPRPGYFRTEEDKARFTEECETWMDLGLHPHIVTCHYVRRLGGIPRVFAEYVGGGTLRRWIRTRRLYEGGREKAVARVLDIAIQVAWGLHYAHEKGGLVHRDVKPANVLMTLEGVAKVTDFGLAQARLAAGEKSGEAVRGRTIVVPGGGAMTPEYASPEQAAGKPLTRRTDIWSWAVLVFEMFCGEATWPSGTVVGHVLREYCEHGPSEGHVLPIPEGVIGLLGECLRDAPEERPKDLLTVAARCAEVYAAETGAVYPRKVPEAAELQADGLNNWALSFLDLGRGEEAERLLEEALKRDPQHVEATYNRGLVLWRTGRVTDDELVKQLEEVRTTHGETWRDEYLLGLVHLERGDYASALAVLQEAARQAGEERDVQAALAEARRGAGRGVCLRTFQGHRAAVTSAAFSPDGRYALSGSRDETLRLWDVAAVRSGLAPFVHAKPETMEDVTRQADVFSGLLGQASGELGRGNVRRAWHLLEEARRVPGYRRSEEALDLRERIGARGTRKGQEGAWCLRIFEGHKDWVTSVGFSPDRRYVLSGSGDKTLKLWEVSSGVCLRTFEGHENWVLSVAFSPDGRYALSGSADYTLRLWDVSSGACLRTFQGHSDAVLSVAFSPDGQYALSGCVDHTLRLWDVSNGVCLRTFAGHKNWVRSVAFSPNGRYALSGSDDKTLKLWDVWNRRGYLPYPVQWLVGAVGFWEVSSGLCLWTFDEHEGMVLLVAFSPDGRYALSGSDDKTLKLWDVSIWKCLRTFEGHEGTVRSVAFSPDGRYGLSGSDDKTLKLWDVSSGTCLWTFQGHSDAVLSVAFSPDGRYALSGSEDHTLRLWELLWKYEFPTPADWDEGARPYLTHFLTLCTPYAATLPKDRPPSDDEVRQALTRRGTPTYSEDDFQRLLLTLSRAGYGWLRPEGVKRELEKMAAAWQGPPALPEG